MGRTVFDNIRADLARACRSNQASEGMVACLRELFNPGTQAILIYRFGFWADGLRPAPLRYVMRLVHFPLQYVFGWRVGIFIPVKAKIGPGFVIHTWGGGIFIPATTIGRDLTVIGGGVQMDYEVREIGDEVRIGPGTKVIGKIRIGHRARTAPNSVVNADIPDDCVVFGNPGRVMGPVRTFSGD